MPLTLAQEIERLRATCKKMKYEFFENGDYNVNLIGERCNDVFENTFSDKLHVVYKEIGLWRLITIPFTTLAGTLGHGGEQQPLTGAETGTGVDGVAVIKEGQYRGVYKFIDSYTGWLWYPYFYQVKEMDYLRDADKNGVITRTGKSYKGNFGTNMHRMSNNNVPSEQVNFWGAGWSQGCQGASEPEFRKILQPVRQAVKLYGDLFTYTLIHSKDFVK